MKNIEYFDYQKVAKGMNVPASILRVIERDVKKEFPSDKMMYELHVLRAIKSKYWQKLIKQDKVQKPLTEDNDSLHQTA